MGVKGVLSSRSTILILHEKWWPVFFVEGLSEEVIAKLMCEPTEALFMSFRFDLNKTTSSIILTE